jgi:hypothetical protein
MSLGFSSEQHYHQISNSDDAFNLLLEEADFEAIVRKISKGTGIDSVMDGMNQK